jgi:hypothetical protein
MRVGRVPTVVGLVVALVVSVLAGSVLVTSIGAAPAVAAPATGVPSSGGAFVPVPAVRVLDTRSGLGAVRGAVRGGSTVRLMIAGVGGVPAVGVSAVMVNVTVTQASGVGVVTAYADGDRWPGTSNLNFARGQTVANLALVRVGADGKLALQVAMVGTVQLVADVQGYYVAGAATAPGAMVPVPPSRVLDSRFGVGGVSGPVSAKATVRLQVAARGPVPAGVGVVVLNLTATHATAAATVTAWADGQAKASASTLSVTVGQTVANLAVVPVGADGMVDLAVSGPGTVQLIADVFGYSLAGPGQLPGTVNTPDAAGAQTIYDTRPGHIGPYGAVKAGVAVRVQLPALSSSAVAVRVTVLQPTGSGVLTVSTYGAASTATSNLNFVRGTSVGNLATLATGAVNSVVVRFTGSGTVQLVVDIQATWTPVVTVTSALLETLSGGIWATTKAPSPPDAVSPPKFLQALQCPVAGTCTAVGYYTARADGDSLIETLSSGQWTVAKAPIPSGYSKVDLRDLSCPTPDFCGAAGEDYSATQNVFAVLETETGGVWSAIQAPLPTDIPSILFAEVDGLSCPTAGLCHALVQYRTASSGGSVIDTLVNGTWTATTLPLPADAGPLRGSTPRELACADATNCVVIGSYGTTSNVGRLFIDQLANGTWTSTAFTLPPAATHTVPDTYHLVCPTATSCVFIGKYTNASFGTYGPGTSPFIATQTPTGWNTITAPLPADSSLYPGGGLLTMSCPQAGSCVAGGYYTSGTQTVPILEILSAGTWSTQPVPVPANTTPTRPATIDLITCPSTGTCHLLLSYYPQGHPSVAADTFTNSTFTTTELPIPVDHLPTGATGPPMAISCPTTTDCVALSAYETQPGTQ